jgi:hypothetical protein
MSSKASAKTVHAPDLNALKARIQSSLKNDSKEYELTLNQSPGVFADFWKETGLIRIVNKVYSGALETLNFVACKEFKWVWSFNNNGTSSFQSHSCAETSNSKKITSYISCKPTWFLVYKKYSW